MKFTFLSVLICTTLLFTTLTSQAESYRWVDEYGKVRIGIKPPPKPIEMDEEEDVVEETSVIPAPAPPKIVKERKPVASQPVVNQQEKLPRTAAPVATTPAPAAIVPAPKVTAPAKVPVASKPAKTVQKPSVKKPVAVKKKPPAKKLVVKKSPAKKPVVKKNVVKKKPAVKAKKPVAAKKATPVESKTAAAKSDNQRNEDMCGVFTGYVRDYEEKVSNCSKNLCDIYQRSLDRYKKKQKSYCGK